MIYGMAELIEGDHPLRKQMRWCIIRHYHESEEAALGRGREVLKRDIEQRYGSRVRRIVEICTDDMPYLVDSVGMCLNRHGLALHQVIHPLLRVRRDSACSAAASASPTSGISNCSG